VYDGIPVFLLPEAIQTHPEAAQALDPRAIQAALALDDGTTPPPSEIHPVVRERIAGSSGHLYFKIRDRLQHYPIPRLRLPPGEGKTFLDIGCFWGRWSIAAARKGYRVTGIDPNFAFLVVARRVCRQLGVDAQFVCADARHLPFPSRSFDTVFGYSVLQHFSKADAKLALREIGRVTAGGSLIQLANRFGIRSLYNQARALFRPSEPFAVRYWTPAELRRVFSAEIGPSTLSIEGFFGLGVGAAETTDPLLGCHRTIVRTSERLRRFGMLLPVADSLYVGSRSRRNV
jgi:ubiquinone/menaquinone biosynthesis C-methylase UbiE